MTPNPEAQQRIRRYLLGELGDGAQEEFEQELLTDAELFDELLMLEEELVDEYLAGKLTAGERRRFESHFLTTAERHEKLNFARAFNRYLSAHERVPLREGRKGTTAPVGLVRAFFSSRLQFAVYAAVLVAIGLGIWSVFRHSPADKSLIALNAAYREARPIEPRISGLNYAPYSTTRGPGEQRVDQNELRRAELTLLEAEEKNRSPAVLHALGKFYLAKRQFDDAINYFEEALKGEPNNSQLYSDLGAAWLEKGRAVLDSEPGKGMEEVGRSQENLNKALQLNPNSLEALFNRALSRESLTLYPQAEEDWREYIRKDPNSPWTGEAKRHLKLLEERKARTARDKDQLREDFLAAYRNKDDEAAWAALSRSRARTGNGIIQFLINDLLLTISDTHNSETMEKIARLSYAGKVEYQKVSDRFTSDLASFYHSADSRELREAARAREMMKDGMECYDRAEWQKAIDLFSEAAKVFGQSGDATETLFAEAWTGYCYLRVPDHVKGGKVFQRLARVFEERRYKSLLAQSLLAQSDVLSSENEYSKVLEKANESLVLSQQIEDYANAVRCLQVDTSSQLAFGNYRESLDATKRALELADSLPRDPRIAWPFYHEAAMSFYFLGMPMTAMQFETRSLRIALEAGLPFHASRSYDRLAVLSARMHRYDESIKYSEQARVEGGKIADENARTNTLAHADMTLAGSCLEAGDSPRAIALYDEALELYARLNLDIYQYRAHKGRLLALMALNDNAAADSELAIVLKWFEQNRQKIAEESYRNKFFDTDQNTYDIAVDFAYSRKGDSARAFDYAETSRARSLLDLMTTRAPVSHDPVQPQLRISGGTSPLTLSQIQSQLPPQIQLLEYVVLEDKLIAWVITRDGQQSAQTLVTRGELSYKVKNYLDSVLRSRTNAIVDFPTTAKALYALLITPIEKYLRRDLQIVIVPADDLNFVPFGSLVSPNSGRYLIEDYALAVAPSATVFVHASEQASRKTKNNSEQLLIVGNPRFDHEQFPKLPDLPAATREAEAIASTYGANALISDEATVSRVKREFPKCDVAHFATHAISDEKSPLLSKLLLAGDNGTSHHASPGFLQANEIYDMNMQRTRLVVLSACQTGIERSYRGEGAIGLARPFLAAGVPLVVASLWPVQSEATADLMISFHKHRRQDHVSTVEALRSAQLEAIHQQQSATLKNYEWASFVAIGGYASF